MIFETYSYRKRLDERNGEPEVYSYETAPDQLRHQLAIAICEGIGNYSYNERDYLNANEYWDILDQICSEEIFSYLDFIDERNLSERFSLFLKNVKNIDDLLSAIEIACRILCQLKNKIPYQRGAKFQADASIIKINRRFDQHAVGYQFENSCIIRMDSKLTHAEIIKPALKLLTAPLFTKGNEEFLIAHRHYREGNYKDCITAANRSFESVLKAICDAENWEYKNGSRASDLVKLVKTKGLFTHDFDGSFDIYVSMLKNGLPSVRNNAGAHGDGLAAAEVTVQIARFALNLTASNIIFLAESFSAQKN